MMIHDGDQMQCPMISIPRSIENARETSLAAQMMLHRYDSFLVILITEPVSWVINMSHRYDPFLVNGREWARAPWMTENGPPWSQQWLILNITHIQQFPMVENG